MGAREDVPPCSFLPPLEGHEAKRRAAQAKDVECSETERGLEDCLNRDYTDEWITGIRKE